MILHICTFCINKFSDVKLKEVCHNPLEQILTIGLKVFKGKMAEKNCLTSSNTYVRYF